MSWEDWKKVEKEKAAKEAMVAAEEESQMLEYRKQLDQDRNALLAKGKKNAHLKVQALNNPPPPPPPPTFCGDYASFVGSRNE